MKTKPIFAALTILSLLLFAASSHAQNLITPINSGNWSSTVPDQPWPGGVLPTTNDLVEVIDNVVITVDTTNAICQAIDSQLEDYGVGTVTMLPGTTLTISGQNAAYGSEYLDVLNATATNCTVNYQGNSFWAKRTDYYNLVFSGWGDFYNGIIPYDTAHAMNIYGNFIVNGTNIPPGQPGYTGCYVECGDDFTIHGDLVIGESNAWDCSVGQIVVMGNTYCQGIMWDKDSNLGSNYFGGNVTVIPSQAVLTNLQNTLVIKMGTTNPAYLGTHQYGAWMGSWYVMDVQQWAVGGNFTNNGIVDFGTNYGEINFAGTGAIAGSNAIVMPTMKIDGTYEIETPIILTTNAPAINGTVVFDVANTNEIVLTAGTNWFWYSTNGTLEVTNPSGVPFVSGHIYQLFLNLGNTNYSGNFAATYLPTLPSGFSWGPASALATNYLPTGSISVIGPAGLPVLHISENGANITLSWDSATYPGYSVQAKTNRAGVNGGSWSDAGSGGVSPFTVPDNPTNTVFFRLYHP